MATAAPALTKERPGKAPGKYYPIRLALAYSAFRNGAVVQRGNGETVEISSTRVRLTSVDVLDRGITDIQLSVAWPVALEDGTPLQFVVRGRPAWDGEQLAAVVVSSYEFRTAARRPVIAAHVSERATDQRWVR